MAEQDDNSSATATDPGTSAGQNQTVGSESTQPAAADQVDPNQAEDKGNSGSSDGSDGTDGGDGERRRPGRAERRISELTAQLQDKQNLEEENKRLRALLDNPLTRDQVKLPDRSGQSEITPEQYNQDVVSVADQIVKARLSQILGENNQMLTKQQQTDRVLQEIKEAPKRFKELDPNSEQYDPVLENYLAKTFERSFKADPTYSFNDLAEETLALRGATKTNTKVGSTKTSTSQGALKPAASKPAHKPIEEMSSDEYLAHLRANR